MILVMAGQPLGGGHCVYGGAFGAAGGALLTPVLHSFAQSLRSFATSLQNRGGPRLRMPTIRSEGARIEQPGQFTT
ncbi:hypothetical protein GCM10011588_52080 [Nocardia jinanensis]|uniref:Uncharacterized protein n=1 Tax=Nocardia jinanensis TaxID=382504 RepID=A0A917RTP3_9NOCA|nr:hypothetical protein GCM10011588_52080 [Nocardia jinanensis]